MLVAGPGRRFGGLDGVTAVVGRALWEAECSPSAGMLRCARRRCASASRCACRFAGLNATSYEASLIAISAGAVNTCAVTSTGAIKCWGHNGSGELGDGTTADSSTPVDVVGLLAPRAAVRLG